MEHIFFKGPVWESVTRALNAQTGNFVTKKVIQKHNGLRQKQCKWSLLLNHTGLGWDEIIQTTQIVIGTDEVWGNVVVISSLLHLVFAYLGVCHLNLCQLPGF